MTYCTQAEFDRKILSGEWFNSYQTSHNVFVVNVRGTGERLTVCIR